MLLLKKNGTKHKENWTYFPELNSDGRKKTQKTTKEKKPLLIQAETFDSDFYFVVEEA